MKPTREVGLEAAARAGYVAKGAIYALIGVLAFRQALGAGGETSGGREAIETFAGGPFGRIVLALLCLGLAGYVVWRLVQGLFDPGADRQENGAGRIAMRIFYLASGVLYGLLAFYAVQLFLGTGGGGEGQDWTGRSMSHPWGRWLVGATGLGIAGRGVFQFVKSFTASFRDRIRSHELGSRRETWAVTVSRIGLIARGVIFSLAGGFTVFAAIRRDPGEARGLSGVLDSLRDRPWLLAAIGAGLVCYALYQWVKARWRLIEV